MADLPRTDQPRTDATSSDATDSDHPRADLSRRRLLQAAGAAALVAGATTALGSGAAAAAEDTRPELPPFRPRGRLTRRPNFLVIVVDEMRYAPVYESQALKDWRERTLKAQNQLRRNGLEFTNHHIMATACAPSRASFFTGQYPSLHGVSQTSGAAKSAIEQDLYWLDPTTVPTMGHWFRAAGYDTYYKGKWHVSDADLYQPGTYNALPSYTDDGIPDPDLEQVYLDADRLDAYGFTGWVGPEPHGQSPLNSGSSAGPGAKGRDDAYAAMAVKQLKALRKATRPWLLVTSFVDPHDITLWGNLTLASQNYYLARQLQGSTVPRDLMTADYDTSANEDLSGKPSAQASYRGVYPLSFQPTDNNEPYRRFYYQLHENVDKQIRKVLDTLTGGPKDVYRDTVVIFLSDHGELLGAHGNLFQKWHQAYDEVLKVPFVVHNPVLFPKAQALDEITSHADLIPTMLGLAGLEEKQLRKALKKTHTQVKPLPGRDLSGVILGEDRPASVTGPVYFMTDDEPTRGANETSWNGQEYYPVAQPCHLETVVAWLPTGPRRTRERWKYTRYFDNPDFWTSPGRQDVFTLVEGRANQPGTKTAITTVKSQRPTGDEVAPPPDQIEVYNVTRDPLELTDLAADPASAAQVAELATLLQRQRAAKRLTPTTDARDPGILGGIGV